MNLFRSRTFRQGSLATAITICGVAVIILICALLTTLSAKMNWSIDMTKEKRFEISKDTIEYIGGLQKNVNIYVLNTEDGFTSIQPVEYTIQANEIIKKYAALSDRINVEYVDIQRNPTFAARFPSELVSPNQILLECTDNGRIARVEIIDLFNIGQNQNSGQTEIRSSKAEQTMTSAILNVASDKQLRAVMLTGHNESSLAAFSETLTKNNYEITTANLITEAEIDPEATVAFLAAPQRDLSEEELRKLDVFLNNGEAYGKTLVYLPSIESAEVTEFPNLMAWLAEWGIGVGESVVFEGDTSRSMMGDFCMALVDYAETEFSARLIEKNLYNMVPYAKPLSVVFEEKSARSVKTLLQFSAKSGVLSADLANRMPTEADMSGPIPALLLGSEVRYDNMTPKQSHVLAAGSLYMLDASVLSTVTYANAEYFLGVIDTLAGREESIRIQDKTISIDTMQITAAQGNTIFLVTVVILPIGLLVFGIVVWMRRRHR